MERSGHFHSARLLHTRTRVHIHEEEARCGLGFCVFVSGLNNAIKSDVDSRSYILYVNIVYGTVRYGTVRCGAARCFARIFIRVIRNTVRRTHNINVYVGTYVRHVGVAVAERFFSRSSVHRSHTVPAIRIRFQLQLSNGGDGANNFLHRRGRKNNNVKSLFPARISIAIRSIIT